MANPRVHATTQRSSTRHSPKSAARWSLPLLPYRTVLRLERRISHEGMISVGGNTYSVPDTTRRRVVEVHSMVDEIRIFEAGVLIASHIPAGGRHQRRIDPAHREPPPPANAPGQTATVVLGRAGDVVARRSLDFLRRRRPPASPQGGSA